MLPRFMKSIAFRRHPMRIHLNLSKTSPWNSLCEETSNLSHPHIVWRVFYPLPLPKQTKIQYVVDDTVLFKSELGKMVWRSYVSPKSSLYFYPRRSKTFCLTFCFAFLLMGRWVESFQAWGNVFALLWKSGEGWRHSLVRPWVILHPCWHSN